MTVRLLVELTVEDCDPAAAITDDEKRRAAQEGVRGALKRAEQDGFTHPWENDVSIIADTVAITD